MSEHGGHGAQCFEEPRRPDIGVEVDHLGEYRQESAHRHDSPVRQHRPPVLTTGIACRHEFVDRCDSAFKRVHRHDLANRSTQLIERRALRLVDPVEQHGDRSSQGPRSLDQPRMSAKYFVVCGADRRANEFVRHEQIEEFKRIVNRLAFQEPN